MGFRNRSEPPTWMPSQEMLHRRLQICITLPYHLFIMRIMSPLCLFTLHIGSFPPAVCIHVRYAAFVVPSFFSLLVDVGQYVSSTARPLTDHHRDRRTLLKVLQHRQNHIRTTFKDKCHDRNTLTDPWRKTVQNRCFYNFTFARVSSFSHHIMQTHPGDSWWEAEITTSSSCLSACFHHPKINRLQCDYS